MIKNNNNLISLKKRKRYNIFLKNPTIMCQLSIAPIVSVGVSLSNALALSLAMFLITTPTLVIFGFIANKNKIKKQYSTMIALFISSLVYSFVGFLFKNYCLENFELLGIFLPMLVINSIIIIKSRGFKNKTKSHWVFLDSLVYVIVFSVETCLISIIREILGKNMILGHRLNLPISFPALLLPFSGFVFVGLFAALMQIIYKIKFSK